ERSRGRASRGGSPAVNAAMVPMVRPAVPAAAVIIAPAVIVGAAAMVVAAVVAVAAAVKSGSDDDRGAISVSVWRTPAVDGAMERESASPRRKRYRGIAMVGSGDWHRAR